MMKNYEFSGYAAVSLGEIHRSFSCTLLEHA